MVRIFFTNGNQADMDTATQVKPEVFIGTGGANPGTPQQAIVCQDAQGNEVGRFKVAEITGYLIRQSAGSAGRSFPA